MSILEIDFCAGRKRIVSPFYGQWVIKVYNNGVAENRQE